MLKNILPRTIRKRIYKLGKKLYLDKEFPSIEGSLDALKSWGFNPASVVDVGAYHGEWTRMFLERFPDTQVLMLEAQQSKIPTLQQVCAEFPGKVLFESALLGPEHGKEVAFNEMETGSSVFEETSPYQRNQVTYIQTTLDTLAQTRGDFQKPDFLKLDVQGYELEVLKGATQMLQQTQVVLMESSLIPINSGAPLIDEVMAFMAARNFRLLDFCSQIRRKDDALWQTDLLFIHNESPFIPPAELNEGNW